jgi:hypothetical protein
VSLRRSELRASQVLGAIAAACVGLSALASCILADPPPDLPKPPARHPNIVHAQVTPPADRPLGELLPDGFSVPVELPDPTRSFEWRVFVDYDEVKKPTPRLIGSGGGTPTALDTEVVSFSVDLLEPGCHRIEFIVALHFDPSIAHASDGSGSDSVTWFYTPTGSLGGCTTYDAGPDGPGTGAFSDAGDGG